jgi:hypothetical protein
MKRTMGFVLAVVLAGLGLMWPSTAWALEPVEGFDESGANGGHAAFGEPFGGFGLTAVPRRARPQGVQAASAHRGRARKALERTAPPAAYPLPTGSLHWPQGGAVSLYSPAERYQSYQSGYARSPYGSADYGMAYKGYYWGY